MRFSWPTKLSSSELPASSDRLNFYITGRASGIRHIPGGTLLAPLTVLSGTMASKSFASMRATTCNAVLPGAELGLGRRMSSATVEARIASSFARGIRVSSRRMRAPTRRGTLPASARRAFAARRDRWPLHRRVPQASSLYPGSGITESVSRNISPGSSANAPINKTTCGGQNK